MNLIVPVFIGLLLPSVVAQDATEPVIEQESEATPWWRSIQMKPLFSSERGETGLPAGWRVVGGPANYTFETGPDGVEILHGSGNAPRNAFLVDPAITGDFLLEFDVLIDRGGGNSGVQIRSQADQNRMVGYQIEIDPSERSWSGGLYDEGRRGWIASLADNIEARDAFVPGKWNRFTVLAIGPRIRTWMNGVPAVDHLDFADPAGQIGLQVHGGRCDVRWRGLMIGDLGQRSRKVFAPDESTLSVTAGPVDGIIRGIRDGRPTFELSGDGVVLDVEEPMPDAPSVLEMVATIQRGSIRVQLGDTLNGPGYVFTVPAPLGKPDDPGIIRVVRSLDGMTVLIDESPLVPGPTRIDGPLDISIETGPGVEATIDRIVLHPPTATESKVIDEWRAKSVPSRSGE